MVWFAHLKPQANKKITSLISPWAPNSLRSSSFDTVVSTLNITSVPWFMSFSDGFSYHVVSKLMVTKMVKKDEKL